MKADEEHIDQHELLVRYIAGEAGAEERAEAELWINASPANRQYYEHLKLLWDESQKLAQHSAVNEDLAWERFRTRVQQEYLAVSKFKALPLWLKVAAIIVLGLAVTLSGSYLLSRYDRTASRDAVVASNEPAQVYINSVTTDSTKADTLPDRSVITLNRNSKLTYPAAFTGHTRNVALQGEAFFRVVHNSAKPFVIRVNEVTVTVLGTTFNVYCRDGKTEVSVETGMVKVSKHAQNITLNAGEQATVDQTDTVLKKMANTDRHYTRYLYNNRTYAYATKNNVAAKADTPFDINKHPDILKQILKDPAKWPQLLKNYKAKNDNIQIRRAVVRNVLDEMVKEKVDVARNVISFRLNENELIINDIRQPDAVHQRFKDKFIKEPGYTIYFGGAPRPANGKGIFLSPDSL